MIATLSLSAMMLLAPLQATTRPVTLAWDQPTGETWTEVRIYETVGTTDVLQATAKCSAPGTCPTTITFTTTKILHHFFARSYNGDLESDNSNTATLPGPPKPPGNLRR
jgi:hypothetical protein